MCKSLRVEETAPMWRHTRLQLAGAQERSEMVSATPRQGRLHQKAKSTTSVLCTYSGGEATYSEAHQFGHKIGLASDLLLVFNVL